MSGVEEFNEDTRATLLVCCFCDRARRLGVQRGWVEASSAPLDEVGGMSSTRIGPVTLMLRSVLSLVLLSWLSTTMPGYGADLGESCLIDPTLCPLGTFRIRKAGTQICRCAACLPGSFRSSPTVDLCTLAGADDKYVYSTSASPAARNGSDVNGYCTYFSVANFLDDYYNPLVSLANDGALAYTGPGQSTTFPATALLQNLGLYLYGGMNFGRTAQAPCGYLQFAYPPAGGYTWNYVTSATSSGKILEPFILANHDGAGGRTPMNFSYVTGASAGIFNLALQLLPQTKSDVILTYTTYLLGIDLAALSPQYRWSNGTGASFPILILPFQYWSQNFNTGSYTTPLVINVVVHFVPPSLLANPDEFALDLVSGTSATKDVTLYNVGQAETTFNASIIYFGSSTGWLKLGQLQGSLNTSCEVQVCLPVVSSLSRWAKTIVVNITATKLPAGEYGASVTWGGGATTKITAKVAAGVVNYNKSTVQIGLEQTGTFGKNVDVASGVEIWILLRDSLSSSTATFADGSAPDLNQFNVTARFVTGPGGACTGGPLSWCLPVLLQARYATYGWTTTFLPTLNGTYNITAVHSVTGTSVGLPVLVKVGPIDCSKGDTASILGPSGRCECPPGYGVAQTQYLYVSCEQCSSGWFSPGGPTQPCERCPSNRYSNALGSTECRICTGNTGTGAYASDEILPLRVGSMVELNPLESHGFAPDFTQSRCDDCRVDWVNTLDQGCAPCAIEQKARYVITSLAPSPSTGSSIVPATWRIRCVCKPSYYTVDSPTTGVNGTGSGGANATASTAASCAACPSGAYCFGRTGSTLLPLRGYFQTPWNPLEFQQCRNQDSCPGVDIDTTLANTDWYLVQQEYAYLANASIRTSALSAATCPDQAFTCTRGFTGALCFKCDVGYTRVGVDGCQDCIPGGAYIAALTIGLLLAVALTAFLVRRAVVMGRVERTRLVAGYRPSGPSRQGSAQLSETDDQDEEDDDRETSDATREVIALKILTSHLQEVAVSVSFHLSWPTWLVSMFEVFAVLSSAGQSLFSLSCLLDPAPATSADSSSSVAKCLTRENVTSNVDEFGLYDASRVRSFFVEAIFLTCVPVVWGLCSFLFWMGFYLRQKFVVGKNRGRSAVNFFALSNIVLLFLMYPTLTRTALRFYSCSTEQFGGRRFLEADFNVVCFGATHVAWAASLGVFMVVVFAVGAPLVTFLVLRHHHRHLSRYRPVYGFVFEGFKRRFYAWETLIMVRKLLFSVCAVLLAPLGADLQAYAGLAVLMIFIQLQSSYQPYRDLLMNRIEQGGLMARFTTILLGLALDSGNSSIAAVTFFGAMIVTVNSIFLIVGVRVLLTASAKARSHGLMAVMGMAEGGGSVRIRNDEAVVVHHDSHEFGNPAYGHMSTQGKLQPINPPAASS